MFSDAVQYLDMLPDRKMRSREDVSLMIARRQGKFERQISRYQKLRDDAIRDALFTNESGQMGVGKQNSSGSSNGDDGPSGAMTIGGGGSGSNYQNVKPPSRASIFTRERLHMLKSMPRNSVVDSMMQDPDFMPQLLLLPEPEAHEGRRPNAAKAEKFDPSIANAPMGKESFEDMWAHL